jgi:AraC-like DNA-binding protein
MEKTDVFHIHTSQPYFVLKTDSFCQHVIATCGISHFYSCYLDNTSPESVPFVPDGCSNIIFSYRSGSMSAQVLGSTVTTKPFILEQCVDYFGVRFLPGENPCFSNLTVKDLVDNTVSLTDFPVMDHLRKCMEEQETFTTRMYTFLEEYRLFLNKTENTQHQLFRQISRLIAGKSGMLRISELESLTGYSARYINYIFENEAGISAKRFCRIVKLQTVLNSMNSGDVANLSKLAVDFHFYDQSHFIHEFEQFTGKSPTNYLDAVISKKYRQCVRNL